MRRLRQGFGGLVATAFIAAFIGVAVGPVVAVGAGAAGPVAVQQTDKVWQQVAAPNAKGYALLLRHAIAPGTGDPAGFRLGDCSTQRNLSDEGRKQARDIGSWLRAQNLKIASVETSRWCRATETAELLNLAKPRANPSLDSLFTVPNIDTHPKTKQARQQIINHRNKQGLLVLVGHQVNIASLTGVAPASGEGVLVKATPTGKIKVLGRSRAP